MTGSLFAAGAAAVLGGAGYLGLRPKGLDQWLPAYLRTAHLRRSPRPGEPLTVYLAVCDHYEPKRGNASPAKARGRVRQWVNEYPRLFDRFQDSAGRPPRHTFFYPEDEYDPELVDMVVGLCRRGYGEVEVHLHHDNDTAEGLRDKLMAYKETLADRHGLLSRDRETGEVSYGFIHGNWCLDNSRRDGRYCGVTNELDMLRETGCYADFTMPSAPDETQTRTINSIYWAVGDPTRRKAHDTGVPVGTGPKPDRGLMMVQGPLVLDWAKRKFGVLPGVENGNIQKTQPPSEQRLDNWVRAGIKLPRVPNSAVIKLHTHGLQEPNQAVLLGPPMVALHDALARRAAADPAFQYFYVTARELVNAVLAAAAGRQPTHADFDFRYSPVTSSDGTPAAAVGGRFAGSI